VAIQLSGLLTQTSKRITRRQQDNLPNWLKGTATFDQDINNTGYSTAHTGYYYQQNNLERPVELLEVNRQIHWYNLMYNTLWGQYKVDIDDQIDTDNEYLGYYPIYH
jgi:hypothetical protein